MHSSTSDSALTRGHRRVCQGAHLFIGNSGLPIGARPRDPVVGAVLGVNGVVGLDGRGGGAEGAIGARAKEVQDVLEGVQQAEADDARDDTWGQHRPVSSLLQDTGTG